METDAAAGRAPGQRGDRDTDALAGYRMRYVWQDELERYVTAGWIICGPNKFAGEGLSMIVMSHCDCTLPRG